MQVYVLLPLALFASLTYQGTCEETAAQATSDDSASSSAAATSDSAQSELSRAKRGSYDMMRLGRGLHMLRLGKRGGAFPEGQEDLDALLNVLAGSYGDLPEYPAEFEDADAAYPYGDFDSPVHPRFRRSTPQPDGVVAPEVLQKGSSEIDTVDDSQVDDDEDGYYGYYPDDYLYGGYDEFLEPEEGGFGEENGDFDEEDQNMDKRQGEDLNEAFEGDSKRALSMLRLGKRPMSMLRLGKRPMSMLRLGKRPMSMLRLGKRPMSMLRLGKRPMSMLRLGKRPMSMLRLGKRPMSMLRLGKRPMSMLRLGKRPMSMLRLGKRPMSMLRLGKRQLHMLRMGKREEDEKEKRAISMLRLGKRSAQ